MPTLWLDIETYSEADLKAVGAYRYAEHSTTEVMLFAYAVGDAPAQVWDCTADPAMPADLRDALNDRDVIRWAHNTGFERPVLSATLGIDPDPARWRDTMALALTLAMPANLEDLGTVVGLGEDAAKIKDGKRLVQKFCKPAPANRKVQRHTRETDPEDWAQFVEYARRDVEAMRAIAKRLPDWNYRGRELALWMLDQRINDRGIYVDLDLADAAIAATEREQQRLAERTDAITDGEVVKATQRDKLLDHIRTAYGVELTDAREATLKNALASDGLPGPVQDLIRIRLQASKASTAKYSAIQRATNTDSRIRGTLQYYGASRTGRWAGRRLQPQNLPRPSLDQDDIEQGIQAMKDGNEDLLYDDIMELGASCLRSVITAAPGNKLVVSDLSNIEGRALAWLAGEESKLQRFHEFDAGRALDIYKVTAGNILGKDPASIDKGERLVLGKVPELALGYQGGVGAFQSMAAVYGTDMAGHWPTLQQTLPASVLERAEEAWKRRGKGSGLDHDTWTASEAVKVAWRDRHPETVSFWYDLENAVKAAIRAPDTDFQVRRLTIRRTKHWLLIRLPSGRLLVYVHPKIKSVREPAEGGEQCRACGGTGASPVNSDNPCPDCEGKGGHRTDEKITYMGVDSYTYKWRRLDTYGGKLVENITQAASRDVLREGMFRAEDAGYIVILTVHDELVTETPDEDRFSEPDLSQRLAVVPDWAEGLPLAAEGYEAHRYRKD